MARINGLMENIGKYGQAQGPGVFFLPAPTWVDQVELDGAASSTYTIPTDASMIVISAPGYDYWVRVDAAAVVPVAGLTDGLGSFANPTQLDVRGVTTLGIISDTAMFVTIAVFK